MDIQEKLVESHKAISRFIAWILFLVILLSVYIIQRALLTISGSGEMLEGIMHNYGFQIMQYNLGFSYTTMTVLWPGVLGTLCLGYVLLYGKRNRVAVAIRLRFNDTQNPEIMQLDPFLMSRPLFNDRITRIAAHLFAGFPMTAVVVHVLMLAVWGAVTVLGEGQYGRHSLWAMPADIVFLLVSALFSVFGFLTAMSFRKTIIRGIDGSDEDDTRTDSDKSTQPILKSTETLSIESTGTAHDEPDAQPSPPADCLHTSGSGNR